MSFTLIFITLDLLMICAVIYGRIIMCIPAAPNFYFPGVNPESVRVLLPPHAMITILKFSRSRAL
jgi:hypothetical protein